MRGVDNTAKTVRATRRRSAQPSFPWRFTPDNHKVDQSRVSALRLAGNTTTTLSTWTQSWKKKSKKTREGRAQLRPEAPKESEPRHIVRLSGGFPQAEIKYKKWRGG